MLNLAQDTRHTRYTDSIAPATVQDLPNLTGMDRLRDLIEAAALSPALADVLTRFAAAGTHVEQHGLLDELLLDWAKTDPRYSEDPVRTMSSSTPDPNSTNIIYLRPGQALPVYLTNTTYADASIDVQHHVRVLDAIRGDRVTNVLNEASAQESSAAINTAYTALADAVYDALLLQTRLRPYMDEIALTFDENGLRFDFSAMQQLLATRFAADPSGALGDLLDLNKAEGDSLLQLQPGCPTCKAPAWPETYGRQQAHGPRKGQNWPGGWDNTARTSTIVSAGEKANDAMSELRRGGISSMSMLIRLAGRWSVSGSGANDALRREAA